jgi:hypothetical protein
MPSSGMLHRVAFVKTDVSEEPSASIIRVTTIGEVGTTSHIALLFNDDDSSYSVILTYC